MGRSRMRLLISSLLAASSVHGTSGAKGTPSTMTRVFERSVFFLFRISLVAIAITVLVKPWTAAGIATAQESGASPSLLTFGDAHFTVPPGWRHVERQSGASKVLLIIPPDTTEKDNLAILMLPGQDLQRVDFPKAVDMILKQGLAANEHLIQYSELPARKAAGYDFLTRAMVVGDDAGHRSFRICFAAKPRHRLEMLIMSAGSQETFKRYQADLTLLLNSLVFDDASIPADAKKEGSGATHAPAPMGEVPSVRHDGAAPTGTIAYVRDWEQIRLIKPDGTGDRELWTQPPSQSRYGDVHELAFRPDGQELAFSSSHEKAFSYYESDLYGIAVDGKGLHRLTNSPSLSELTGYPKCRVALTITSGPTRDPLASVVVVYVIGASKPESVMVPPKGMATVMFNDVAVIPGALQPVMAAFGGRRWPGPPLRLVAGQTTQASMLLTGRGFEMLGAYRPLWSRDGKQIAYRFGQSASVWRISGEGAPGAGIGTQLGGKTMTQVAAFDWGPAGVPGGTLLYAHGFVIDGEQDNSIYQTDEAGNNPIRVLHYDDPNEHIQQIRWLPDGSGFIFLRMEPMTFGEGANLCRLDLATKRETQLTHFRNEAVRDFAISPDGSWIVYERGQEIYNPWDKTRPALWLIRTDGRDEHRLVESAEMPAWGR